MVIKTNPPAGADIVQGKSEVIIYVVSESRMISVPDGLPGQDLRDAAVQLNNISLKFTENVVSRTPWGRWDYCEVVSTHTVISVDPPPRTEMCIGEGVILNTGVTSKAFDCTVPGELPK